MTRKTKPETATEPAETASEEPSEEWLSTREARMRIGNISPSKWERVRREFRLEGKTDEFGVLRYPSSAVDELADKLGITGDDPRDATIAAQRAEIESLRAYTLKMQESERELVKLLRDENENLRKLRAEEQKAHFEAILATQTALDRSAERQAELLRIESKEKRLEALTAMMAPSFKKLGEQILSTVNVKQLGAPSMQETTLSTEKILAGASAYFASLAITAEQAGAFETVFTSRQVALLQRAMQTAPDPLLTAEQVSERAAIFIAILDVTSEQWTKLEGIFTSAQSAQLMKLFNSEAAKKAPN